MKKAINVAVIGTGFGELVHIPGYSLHPKYEVKGILGRTTEKTSEVAKKHNIQAYSSLEEILDDTEIDMVSIATIPKLHYPYAKAAIDKGKHVILEKPMAMDSAESLELLSAAKRKNVFHAIVHEHRFDPAKAFAKEILQSGRIGTLRSINIQKYMVYWSHPMLGRNYDWFSQKEMGGGMTGAHLSHMMDFLLFIADQGIKSVIGQSFTEVKERYCVETDKMENQTSDDTVYAIIEMDGGVNCIVDISAARHKPEDKITLHCSEGSIRITGQNDIAVYDKEGKLLESSVPTRLCITDYESDFRINTFVVLLECFYQHYFNGMRQELPTFETGHTIQKALESIQKE